MKKVLIIGKSSYIGLAFKNWIEKKEVDWTVETVSSRNDAWKQAEYGSYDCILHLAGIAHVDASAEMEQEYYRVNRDLTVDSCRKAKNEGCKQFVFMSSIIVYGESKSLEPVMISAKTKPQPNGFYGNSKLQAEEGILPMSDDSFAVASVRPPMVYGKNSKGNYPKLAKLAKKCPIFPDMDNQRSMIHVDNLCEFLYLLIGDCGGGVYCPQNRQYVKTTDLVSEIASVQGKRVIKTRLFNPLIRLLARRVTLISKVFGSLCYEQELSDYYNWAYCVHDFKESVKATEGVLR